MIAQAEPPDYAARKAAAARNSFARRQAVSQDVYSTFQAEIDRGPLDPARRAEGRRTFIRFCEIYLRKTFTLAWSPNHLLAAERIEAAVLLGQLFAFGMPRGSGKTALARAAIIWAVAYGLCPYAVLIGATMAAAMRQIKSIKTELRFNPLLFDDFPEMCCPIRHIGGEARKASGQKFQGESTAIEWKQHQIVLATIPVPYSLCSGAIIDVTGIDGEIRGRQFVRMDGTVARPTLAIPDDPQTRESARSASQSENLEAILAGDIKYMAGPDRPLGIVMPCTVIYRNDLADRMLDRKRHSEYHGSRTRMVDAFPARSDLWARYGEIREQDQVAGGNGETATAFYAENQAEMDRGAIVTWPVRYFPEHGEISAIQHAMNLKLLDEAAFMAEGQNEPKSIQDFGALMTADKIAEKLHGHPRSVIPPHCQFLTAFVDCQKQVLLYAVVAWADAFTGYVIEYGAYPKQTRGYFTKASLNPTLEDIFPNADDEGRIYQGLDALTQDICGRTWTDESGDEMKLPICLIDEGHKTETIHRFVRASKFASVLKPSKGYGDLARYRIPFLQTKRRPGDRLGRGIPWRERCVTNGRGLRFVSFDTNYFKSFIHQRLATPVGSMGSLTFYGHKPQEHRLITDHLLAEYPSRVTNESTGRTVDEWQERPGRPDNDFLDVLVGCAVGAAMQGMVVPSAASPKDSPAKPTGPPTERRKKKVTYL